MFVKVMNETQHVSLQNTVNGLKNIVYPSRVYYICLEYCNQS